MKTINIFLIANFISTLILAAFVFTSFQKPRNGFVLNQKVFEGFKGKQILIDKLSKLKKEHIDMLDSLETTIKYGTISPATVQSMREQFGLQEQEIADNYTANLWKTINQYIANYGKEKGYDYILGATGNGNLMYASETSDVTTDVIQYINNHYDND